MKVFVCRNVEWTSDDGNNEAPYIYKNGGVGKPHYCIRVNRKAYVFLIPDEVVPKWFEGDSNIRYLGDLNSLEKLKNADKTVLSSELSVSTLINETWDDMWKRILQRDFRDYKLDLPLMLKRIEAGERHYVDVSV